ncbi:MAG: hypothetical protein ACLS90_07900 [Clostridia bacterium]
MPGFSIHIAVAKEYIRKNKVKDEQELIRGVIDPDYISLTDKEKSKNITHYGEWGDWSGKPQSIDLQRFLKDPKVDLNEDYWKGYFIHLYTDYYFGRRYFHEETIKAKQNGESFYNDYDCLNEYIIKKYDIQIMDKIKKYLQTSKDETKYLKQEKVEKFIEDMSNIDLEQFAEKIMKNGMEEL